MTCSAPHFLCFENPVSHRQIARTAPTPSPALREAPATPPVVGNPLERLAQLVHSNDRLMDELTVSRGRIVAARTYLDRPGCHARFGSAHLERCRTKHTGILAQLRANRIESLHLLGHAGSPG